MYEDTYQKNEQTDVWKQARLSVWKQNRSNAKNILNWLAAVIHTNKRNAAGNSEKVVHHALIKALWKSQQSIGVQ